MPEEKKKLYEFRSLRIVKGKIKIKVIAVVAMSQEKAEAVMVKNGYTVNEGKTRRGFWLERVYDKAFDRIIIA